MPKDKILVPGVIATSYNYVEHPETIAERIMHYAEGQLAREQPHRRYRLRDGNVRRFRPSASRNCWTKLRSLLGRCGAGLEPPLEVHPLPPPPGKVTLESVPSTRLCRGQWPIIVRFV